MQRRRFITMAALGAAAAAWPSSASSVTPVAAHALASPHLLVVLGDEAVVRDLGLRYLQLVPSENDPDILARAIMPGPLPSPADDLNALVDSQVAQDFSDGRTVTVHGWILSVTEARQCALFALRST